MMEKEALDNYERYTETLDGIIVPTEQLAAARLVGLQRAKRERTRTKQLIWVRNASIVMGILIIFFTSIRISPVFAGTVAKIPGMDRIVDLITWDKGMEDIMDQQYYEPLNITVTKNDLTFTIDGVIADESGMIIFYTLEAPYDISQLHWNEINILQNGGAIEGSKTYSESGPDPTHIVEDKIVLDVPEKMDYDHATFHLKISYQDASSTKFNIPFTLQKPIAPTKYYELNDPVTIDGQQFTVNSLSISPLRAQVNITVDENNNMQLLVMEDVILIDESGEEWGNIINGTSAWGSIRDGEIQYNIQSNYFRNPKQLKLYIGNIQALPKGQDYIEVDFSTNEVIYIPEVLKYESIEVNANRLITSMKTNDRSHMREDFFEAIDAEGQRFFATRSSGQYSEEFTIRTNSYPMNHFVNPVRIYLSSYPSYLDGSIEIDIPLQ